MHTEFESEFIIYTKDSKVSHIRRIKLKAISMNNLDFGITFSNSDEICDVMPRIVVGLREVTV